MDVDIEHFVKEFEKENVQALLEQQQKHVPRAPPSYYSTVSNDDVVKFNYEPTPVLDESPVHVISLSPTMSHLNDLSDLEDSPKNQVSEWTDSVQDYSTQDAFPTFPRPEAPEWGAASNQGINYERSGYLSSGANTKTDNSINSLYRSNTLEEDPFLNDREMGSFEGNQEANSYVNTEYGSFEADRESNYPTNNQNIMTNQEVDIFVNDQTEEFTNFQNIVAVQI